VFSDQVGFALISSFTAGFLVCCNTRVFHSLRVYILNTDH
jgi:hypothetical protein